MGTIGGIERAARAAGPGCVDDIPQADRRAGDGRVGPVSLNADPGVEIKPEQKASAVQRLGQAVDPAGKTHGIGPRKPIGVPSAGPKVVDIDIAVAQRGEGRRRSSRRPAPGWRPPKEASGRSSMSSIPCRDGRRNRSAAPQNPKTPKPQNPFY